MKLLMRLGAIAFGLLIALVIGWKVYTKSQEDTLYEVAVRYAAQDTSQGGDPGKLFFLRINKQDPSPALLQRFQGAPFTVRAGSQAIGSSSPFSGHKVRDKNTGEEGTELKFNGINWFRPSNPIVKAGADLYVMKKEYGTWRVDYHAVTVAG